MTLNICCVLKKEGNNFYPSRDFKRVVMGSVSVPAAGLQAVLPEYLRPRFVQAALSYIGCNEEGQLVCRDNDCWCQCAVDYPQCNCPKLDLTAMKTSLLKIRDSWTMANQDFEESGQMREAHTNTHTHSWNEPDKCQ